MPRFECCIRTENSVDKYSTVMVAGNHYSVPDTLVGKRVLVRLYTSKLIIYHEGGIVAVHNRSFLPHDWTIDIYHYLRTLKHTPGALLGSTALLQSDAVVKQIYDTYYKLIFSGEFGDGVCVWLNSGDYKEYPCGSILKPDKNFVVILKELITWSDI